jgi:hypothetical protein
MDNLACILHQLAKEINKTYRYTTKINDNRGHIAVYSISKMTMANRWSISPEPICFINLNDNKLGIRNNNPYTYPFGRKWDQWELALDDPNEFSVEKVLEILDKI